MDNQENVVGARLGDAERPQESGAAAPGRGGRMSRQRKSAAVLRLLRGEDLETVSRELGVTAATLTGWRDAFLAGGEAALATRAVTGEELESERLRAKLGETVLERELLAEKVAALEAGRPLARRRSRRWAGRPHHRSAGRTGSPWSVTSGASPARPSTAIASRRARPGPAGPMPDAELLEAVLAASPFRGEGHRKVWARLRHGGVRTSRR